MSRLRPSAKSVAMTAVKYGPAAKVAWDVVGDQVQESARERAVQARARGRAFRHASTVTAGSVLRVAPFGSVLYVVYSGDEPVACYPPVPQPLAEVVDRADLSRRVRPEDRPAARARARARSARRRLSRGGA